MLDALGDTSGTGGEISVINEIADSYGRSYPNPFRLATELMMHQDLRRLFFTRGWWLWPSPDYCEVAINHSIGSYVTADTLSLMLKDYEGQSRKLRIILYSWRMLKKQGKLSNHNKYKTH